MMEAPGSLVGNVIPREAQKVVKVGEGVVVGFGGEIGGYSSI